MDETPAPRPAPLPTDWRLAVWRTFLRVHTGVVRQLERDLARDRQLPLGWYDVLLQLAEAPDRRLRMAELADRVLLSRSGLTRLVDRLQSEQLVSREPSPDDARGTFTVLERAGLDRLRDATPVHLSGISEYFLSRYTDAELATLGELLARADEIGPG
jgi:DNA-binding MarR family transcriptional regulator